MDYTKLRGLQVLLAMSLASLPSQLTAQAATDTVVPPAGTIQGRITNPRGAPVDHAVVQILPDGRVVLTDARGLFAFTGIGAGLHVLYVKALGYRPNYSLAVMDGDHGWRGAIALAEMIVELPEITVTGTWGKPPEYANISRYDDFFRRRRFGFGTFLTPEQIERRQASHVVQLLQGIPGVYVSYSAPGSQSPMTMRIARCPQQPPPIAIYVNGMRHRPSTNLEGPSSELSGSLATQNEARSRKWDDLAELLDEVHPRDILFMEVYRGVAQIPSDLDRDVCAAIVIWTK
jgi:hypothetical protein